MAAILPNCQSLMVVTSKTYELHFLSQCSTSNWTSIPNYFLQCNNLFFFSLFQMNILLISIFAVASLSTFPSRTYGQELADKSQLTQQTVALTSEDHQPAAVVAAAAIGGGGGEIWQETEREVLIRNERGTKNINNNGGGNGGAGKKGKNKKEKKEKVITSDTQEQTGGKSGIFTLYKKKKTI